ncbi:MAG: hypothetical protein LBU60_00300 [Clostridiales bacterium]|jgi:orotate phosphoribosyltransferase|nr:hypothetical protein [Clostridiales bacterium]
MLKDAQVLQIFKDTESVLKGHFLLKSGRHADTYLHCTTLFSYPNFSEKIATFLVEKVQEKVKNFNCDVVLSLDAQSLVAGYETASVMGVRHFFLEKVSDVAKLNKILNLDIGDKVIILKDVIYSSTNIEPFVNKIKELGIEIVAVASIVDRSGGRVEFDIPFVTLLSMDIKSFAVDDCPLCKQNLPLTTL